MESYLLYFSVGLVLFFAKLLVQSRSVWTRLAVFLFTGAAAGFGVGVLAGFPMPAVLIPDYMGAFIGLFSGALIFWIDDHKWITRPGLAYIITIVPGLILALLIYGLTWAYMLLTGMSAQASITGMQMWSLFIAVGFSIVLGFTFPERWFRRRGLLKDD